MAKKFMITLMGGGDTHVTLTDPCAEAWIDSTPNFPPGEYSVEEEIPVACRYPLEKGATYDEDNPATCHVTTGSWDNDRAMYCKGELFFSLAEVLKYVKKHRIEIVGTYEGYLY